MSKQKIKGKICKNKHIRLFHLSEKNQNNKIFKPRIPKSILIEGENETIARICFSSSMSGAFRAISFNYDNFWSEPLYVHIPETIEKAIENKNVIIPSTDLVLDSKFTNEYWVREKVKMKCIGKAQFKYYGNFLYTYQYRSTIKIKWIEKYYNENN